MSGADNQQERPGFEQWIVGFVDGEGCFSVSLFRNHTCSLGWQVQLEFTVVQGARSVSVLDDLKQFFGCGSVGLNRRHDNHREDLYRYKVRRFADLRDRIVPFFEAHPLRTAKAREFGKFRLALSLMDQQRHLTMPGLAHIAGIADSMNNQRPSRFLESSEAIRQPPRIDVSR